MQGYRLRANYIWVIGILLVLFPNISKASNGQVAMKEEGKKVVQAGAESKSAVVVIPVVIGEKDVSKKSSVGEMGRWLESEKIHVIDPTLLQSRLQARQVSQGDSKITAEFENIEAVVARGTEDFYYKGNDAALEVLKPVFELGLLHMEVTSRNPAYVEQVFQAGLMLIRAYSGVGNPLLATEIAGKLAAYFPGKEPSLTQVPPDVVELWRGEVEKLAAAGASIVLEYYPNDTCEARIHGVAVGTKPVQVHAEMNYMVSLDCGSAVVPLWRVRAKNGERVQVPLIDGTMLTVWTRDVDEISKRREVEFGLDAIAYWASADTVLGVNEDEAVVRLDRGVDGSANALWVVREQDAAGGLEASVDAMMLQVFPAVGLARAEKAESDRLLVETEPWISDWTTPVLFASGAAAAMIGGVFLYDASTQATVMNCSPSAAITPISEQCKGVQEVSFSNRTDYYNEWDKIHRAQIIGYSSVGVGAALVGWGAWRLLSSGAGASKSASGADVGLWGGAESLGATARWKF